MLLRDNPYIAILCLTAVMAGCVAFTAWLRRAEAPATRPFTWLMVAIAAYATTAAIGSASQTPRGIIFWVILETLCSSTVTALFLLFTLHFAQRHQWLTWRRRGMVWAVPVSNMALVLTNPWHRLVWQGVTPLPQEHLVIFHHGPGYLWLAAWFYVYVITGTLLVARSALLAGKLYRQQALAIVLSTLPPLATGTLYVLELVPAGVSLLPMSFLFTGLIYFTTLFRFRLFDVLPIARDTLIENMSDSVLVLDEAHRVIDMNPAALRFAHRIAKDFSPSHRPAPGQRPATRPWQSLEGRPNGLANRLLGKPVAQVLGRWPSLLHHCQTPLPESSNREVLISICQQPPLHINLCINLLYDRQRRPTGKLLVIRDVTEFYQTQLELKRINEVQKRSEADLRQTNALLANRLLKIEALQDQLKEQAVRDGLTGLFNRRYFEEALLAEFSKARRSGTPLAVILLDVDHFKRVNDTYGHQAGDCTLKVFADIICEHIRNSDIACRYGGEEFILALPGMTLEEACQRANKLRVALKETVIQFKKQIIQTTVSAGVGALPEYGGSQDGLISLVDKALYAAKAGGRDRVCKIRLDNVPHTGLPLPPVPFPEHSSRGLH